jgi:hypothetical protein
LSGHPLIRFFSCVKFTIFIPGNYKKINASLSVAVGFNELKAFLRIYLGNFNKKMTSLLRSLEEEKTFLKGMFSLLC